MPTNNALKYSTSIIRLSLVVHTMVTVIVKITKFRINASLNGSITIEYGLSNKGMRGNNRGAIRFHILRYRGSGDIGDVYGTRSHKY